MRLLWYSATPRCSSGYGICTQNMLRWLKQKHTIVAATKHPRDVKADYWNGVLVLEGTNIPVVNSEMDRLEIDYCISLFDIWILKEPLNKWVSWIPIDTEFISPQIISFLKDTEAQIAMSRHGQKQLEKWGYKPFYAPIGVDTDVFKPNLDMATAFRQRMNLNDDVFIIGSVGANYQDDRKGYIRLLQAFAKFHKNHPDSRLYLHTPFKGKEYVPYRTIAAHLSIDEYVLFPDPHAYHFDRYLPQHLAGIYSMFDVFVLPTYGEGFGMPLTEAQSCGVPVIVSDNTTGPELNLTGWLIPTDDDDYLWSGLETWRKPPKPSAILETLEQAYEDRNKLARRGAEARNIILEEYDWNVVWDKYWTPILTKLEGMLTDASTSKRGMVRASAR